MKRKRKTQGAQLGNTNAQKHGSYSMTFTDARTKEAKYIKQVEDELIAAVGGDPSPSQFLLIKRIAVKSFRLSKAESEIVANNGVASNALGHDYLSWCGSLRADLQALHLNDRVSNKILPQKLREQGGVIKVILLPAPNNTGKPLVLAPPNPHAAKIIAEYQQDLEPLSTDSADRPNGKDHEPEN